MANRRPFSALQAWLLREAVQWRRSRRRGRDRATGAPWLPDLFLHEAMHGYFGLPYDRRRLGPHGLPLHGGHAFNADRIGRREYDNARTAVARAARRLDGRGLAQRVTVGPKSAAIILTAEGVRVAARLRGGRQA